MRFLTTEKHFFYTLLFLIGTYTTIAQTTKNLSNNDQKFENLLAEKRKLTNYNVVNDRYRIQIFSGESEKAKKTLQSFKTDFSDIEGTIVFNTPNYKVLVGNFRTRIEAERNLQLIEKKYKNVLLIKPIK